MLFQYIGLVRPSIRKRPSISDQNFGEKTFAADPYDAGSEANSEFCEFIPGPPCKNPGVRDTANAEGYVHIHAGIHGIGDLDASMFDWHNPVAEITIRPIH